MIVKEVSSVDFLNYKKPSTFIAFPSCTLKCDRECGKAVCQNSELIQSKSVDVSIEKIIQRYKDNALSKALVCGGLEPFDSWGDLKELITKFREMTNDDFVIYTGYYPYEIQEEIKYLQQFNNIIIKFGRFVPNQQHHYEELLGVELASPNQFARRIS